MTSYASQPTAGWPTSGPEPPPAEILPSGEDEKPLPAGEWQTGPQPDWHTAPQGRWHVQAAGPQPDPAAQHGQAAQHVPARELWAGTLRDQSPARQPGDPGDPADRTGLADPGDPGDQADRRAVLSYLAVPFLGFLPPLAVYLITLRTSGSTRRHAAQALNMSITVILYGICALILGALLALDTVSVAVLIIVPLLAVLWIVALVYLVLAGIAASRGGFYQIPAWLCATLVR